MLRGQKLINPELRLEVTSRCNAKCIMCPREKMTRNAGDMPMWLFKSLVEQGMDIGATDVSVFGYGEPLLDEELPARIGFCASHTLETHITTNASLLDAETSRVLLHMGLSNMRFSVHGQTPEHYAEVHRGLKYEKVRQNIEEFISQRDRGRFSCAVHMTCIPFHGESIESIRKAWEGHVDYLEIWRPHGWAGARLYREKTPERKKTCGRPASGPVQVLSDGRVVPCCFITNAEYDYGSCYEQTLLQVLQRPEARLFRYAHEHDLHDEVGTPCARCDQLNVEAESPLLYSNRDKSRSIGRTSSTKFALET